MTKITKLVGRQILDSRGNPTIEGDVYSNEIMGRAAVPSGASTGENEAVELRDGGNLFFGKSVQKAVNNINDIISKELLGRNCIDQEDIDDIRTIRSNRDYHASKIANIRSIVSQRTTLQNKGNAELTLSQKLDNKSIFTLKPKDQAMYDNILGKKYNNGQPINA